jgi:hypothetical protein
MQSRCITTECNLGLPPEYNKPHRRLVIRRAYSRAVYVLCAPRLKGCLFTIRKNKPILVVRLKHPVPHLSLPMRRHCARDNDGRRSNMRGFAGEISCRADCRNQAQPVRQEGPVRSGRKITRLF